MSSQLPPPPAKSRPIKTLPRPAAWFAPSPSKVDSSTPARPVLTQTHAITSTSTSSSSSSTISSMGGGRPRKTSLSFRKMLSKEDLAGPARHKPSMTNLRSSSLLSSRQRSGSESDDDFVMVDGESSGLVLLSQRKPLFGAPAARTGEGGEEISSRLAKIGWDDDHITGGGLFMDVPDATSNATSSAEIDVKMPIGQSRSLRTGLVMDESSSPDPIRVGKRSKATDPVSSPFKFGSFSPSGSPPLDTPIKQSHGVLYPPIEQPAFSPARFSTSKPIREAREDVLGSRPLRDRTNVLRKSAPHLAGHLMGKESERRSSTPQIPNPHRRTVSTENTGLSRSRGLKSGLSEQSTPSALVAQSHGANSSISSSTCSSLLPKSISTSSRSSFESESSTALTQEEESVLLGVVPDQSIFSGDALVIKKFQPKIPHPKAKPNDPSLSLEIGALLDGGVGGDLSGKPSRPLFLKRASSWGDAEPPTFAPGSASDWPTTFLPNRPSLGREQAPIMPDTPDKRSGRTHNKALSHGSHPRPNVEILPFNRAELDRALKIQVDAASSSPIDSIEASPTVRIDERSEDSVRKGLLRRLSSSGACSEPSEDGTPTKANTSQSMLGPTPTPSPKLQHDIRLPSGGVPGIRGPRSIAMTPVKTHVSIASAAPLIAPRHSLPQFTLSKLIKNVHHRQSAPVHTGEEEDEDLFDTRFIVLETLGKGAFSQVFKVKEREGGGLFAVKRAKGMFEGVKDRLRHLEEVDILRHLSKPAHPNVIAFVDAWEQSRQLFIQTELCLGSLGYFLEEFGSVVERLDEARSWKIAREMADGLHHIHCMGVIHFDIKPANTLITEQGTLKIGDFGMATRWPRIDANAIIEGSGMGGEPGSVGIRPITDREGDRDYMAPEMLHGKYTMAADVFSFGLTVLEASTNIMVPSGGAAWHALRENDFGVVDFSFLSPAMTDLITRCMRSDPLERPSMSEIVSHPILSRARDLGQAALTAENNLWLAQVLTDAVNNISTTSSTRTFDDSLDDIEMI